MPKQVLFVQGGGEGVHDRWDDKLVDSLRRELGPGYDVLYPRMPGEADPRYGRWKAALAAACGKLDHGAVLVGHSIGATILINMLADDPPDIGLAGAFLISAPFVGDGGWQSDEIAPMSGLGDRLPKGLPIHLYHGGADETAPEAHLALYERAIAGARAHRLPGRDHQLNNDLSEVAADIRRLD